MENPQSSDDAPASDSKHSIFVIVISLLVFALVAMAIRISFQQADNFPTGDQVWTVDLNAEVYAPEVGALVKISPPWDTRHARLYGQNILHPGMRFRRTKADQKNRDIILVATRTGKLKIEVIYDLHLSELPRPGPSQPKMTEINRAAWLAESPGIPVELPATNMIIDSLINDKPESEVIVKRVFEYVSERFLIRNNASDDGGKTIEQHKGNALGVNRAAVTLLRAAHLPSRLVSGLDLSASAKQNPTYWVEVYYQENWHSVDVVRGYFDQLPAHFIPLRKGGISAVETENAQLKSVFWKLQSAKPPQGLLVSDTPKLVHIFDLTRLPGASREILSLLLLLPLGALITEILRQIVGIRTYGTFTPTLLALAAVFVDWFTAAIIFTLVTILGIAGRAMLPELGLTRVPRLSIVFTLVAFLMVMVVSMLNFFDPSVDGSVILLPIVILTTLVDRIYTLADERGLRIAISRLVWTLVAAVLSLLILLQTHWGFWILAYPEIHAVTVAVIILLGSYKGKQLKSYKWLGWIKEPAAKKGA